MKPGILCLLLLLGCTYTPDSSKDHEYALTWSCLSPEGCTRAEQVELLDRAYIRDNRFSLESTRDQSFVRWGELVVLDSLPPECVWLYSLGLYTHDLEPSKLCYVERDFELTLSIPDRDPTTLSMWRVHGRFLGLVPTFRSPSARSYGLEDAVDTGE